MKKRLVIDTSVYITYATYNKIYRLVNAIHQYDLYIYVNEELITEIENNIADCLRIEDADPAILLKAIKEATIFTITQPAFTKSPDPKDNFLFDLALQINSEVIVTQEKALLSFESSPVPIKNLKWFKEIYPVSL